MKFKILYIFVISLIVFSGCKKKLDVENDTNPSIKNIYADPPSVYGVASSMFYNWYINAQTHSWSPAMSMMVMADQGTSSWLNSGMYDLSREPRLPFDNSESYRYAKVFDHYWSKLYANINTSNDYDYQLYRKYIYDPVKNTEKTIKKISDIYYLPKIDFSLELIVPQKFKMFLLVLQSR